MLSTFSKCPLFETVPWIICSNSFISQYLRTPLQSFGLFSIRGKGVKSSNWSSAIESSRSCLLFISSLLFLLLISQSNLWHPHTISTSSFICGLTLISGTFLFSVFSPVSSLSASLSPCLELSRMLAMELNLLSNLMNSQAKLHVYHAKQVSYKSP